MKSLRQVLSTVVFLSCVAPAVGKEAIADPARLKITRGTLGVSGDLFVTPTVVDPANGNSVGGMLISASPGVAVFVAHGLSLGLSTTFSIGVGKLYDGYSDSVAMLPTISYIFSDKWPVTPYVGFGVGPEILFMEGSDTITFIDIGFGVGVLVPLNRHVALSFGLQPSIAIGVTENSGVIFTIPIGFAGVRVFI